jgi:predicted transcriptional regulator
VWAALEAQPGATTAQLAITAGIGRSTAGKILAEWAKDGSVERTPGGIDGGRRTPDRWAIAASAGNTTPGEDTSPNAATSDAANPPDQTEESTAGLTATEVQDDRPNVNVAPIPGDDVAEGTDPATSDAHDEHLRGDVVLGDKPARLGSGALRGLVEDYLRDHAADTFGPSGIGTALGRSAGAVNNALEKLVEIGYARRTQDKPKRFQFNASPESAAE